jgi:hypothetical protein
MADSGPTSSFTNGDGRTLTGLVHDFEWCAKACAENRANCSRERGRQYDEAAKRLTNLETNMGAMNTRVNALEDIEKHRRTDLSAKSTIIVGLLVFLGTVLPRLIDYIEKAATR